MKRLFITSLIMLPLFAAAQVPKIKLNLGLKVGANFNQVDGKYWENGYKANLLGGGFAALNGNRVGGQFEVLFSQSTFTTGENFHDAYGNFYQNASDSLKKGSFKVSYLTIPLLLNLRFSKVLIQLGPQYSGVASVEDRDELLEDASKLFKSGEFAGVIGLWINLPARLNVGVRYIIGLSDLNDSGSNLDDAWKQKTLQVHLGYGLF